MANKRKSLSIEFKKKLLEEVDKGKSKKDICADFDVVKSTLSTIIKNRASIENLEDVDPARKRARTAKHSNVDEALLMWLKQKRAMNVPIGGPLMKAKANELAKELGIFDWEASEGWLHRFKERHGLVFKAVCGESASISPALTENWFQEALPRLLQRYKSSDIFNVDETGLFYQCLPDKTFTFRGEKASKPVKESKQRLTLLVGSNMDGSEKLDLLIIGKFANPRCFKGVRSFPVQYQHNTKAWMTSTIWTEWMRAFDKKMRCKKRHVALVIDNCPAHPQVSGLSHVEVIYLPATTTSKTQPCDQGIIQALKRRYRYYLLERFLHCIDNNQEFKPHVLDAMTIAWRAWGEVSPTTVKNCFKHCGFVADESEVESHDGLLDYDDSDVYAQLSEHLAEPTDSATLIQEYVSVDDDVETCAEMECSEIAKLVSKAGNEEQNEDLDECDQEIPRPSKSEVMASLDVLKNHLLHANDGEQHLVLLNKLHRFIDQSFLSAKQQMHITDYFS